MWSKVGFNELTTSFFDMENAVTDKNHLEILFESVENPIWSVDTQGKLLAFNKAFRNYLFLKYRIEAKPGLQILQYIHQDTLADWNSLFKQAINGKKTRTETKLKLGKVNRYYEISITPVIYKEKIVAVSFISHDITDRKSTVSVLNKAKAQLQAIINNISSLVWLKDGQGNFTIVNQSFINFFEVKDESIFVSDFEIKPIHKEFFDFLSNDSEIIFSGVRYSEERKFKIANITRWFEIHKTPIYNDKSELVGTTGMARDITNRKTIENILLESEEKFRQFAENTVDSFILCSSEAVLYVNPAFEKIYGRSIKEAYKYIHIPGDWIHHEDRDVIKSYFRSAQYLSSGKFNGQYRIIKPDGTISWIWERSFPVTSPEGEIIRYISVASDITRQKQLEDDIRNTQTQQQAILDNIPHMAWLKDITGKYVSVNEAFAQHYARKKDDLIGKTDSDICHPDLAELYAYNDYLVVNTRRQQQFDEFVDTKEGTLYTETIKTPVVDDEGRVIGITGISRDISYFKRIEQQLRANDDKIKALLKNSTDAITVIDLQGRITFDTGLCSRITGKYDFKSEHFINLVDPSDRVAVQEAIDTVIANVEVQQKCEFRSVKQDGTIIYFESFFSNHSSNSLIEGIVVNTRDITERKESLLKEKEYQDNLVFLENTALEFLSISSSEEIYHYIGHKLHELVPESVVIFSSYNQEEDALVIQNLTGIDKFMGVVVDFLGQTPLHYQMSVSEQLKRNLTTSSNKLHHLSGGLYNITNRKIDFMVCKALEKLISMNKAYGMGIVRSGNLLGSIILLTRYNHDIKDPRIVETFMYQASIALLRRRFEKELIASKERAEESDRLKTAFLANMSHEIRTPVNGIIGFSQLLETPDLEEEKKKEFIDVIRTNANALITLIDDIIDVSKIQEGQVKLRNSLMNINFIIDETFSCFLAPKYMEKKLVLDIHKELPDEHAIIMADPLRLRQIINNLLSNAFKFTEKGSIVFGYNVQPNDICFFVKDSGIGIPEDKHEEIFLRFMQADVSFSRRFGGSGLGLAISKGLVELMGGRIWVESVPGEGATFKFTLPRCGFDIPSPEKLAESARNNHTLMN